MDTFVNVIAILSMPGIAVVATGPLFFTVVLPAMHLLMFVPDDK